jgi:hypothetical protein
MNAAAGDEEIRARIEALADHMPDVPVRRRRIVALARRKVLASAAVTLALGVLIAAALALAGNYGSYGLHGSAPLPLVLGGTSVPDVDGLLAARAVAAIEKAGLDAVIESSCPAVRACLVAYTEPAAGSNVSRGDGVKVWLRSSPSHVTTDRVVVTQAGQPNREHAHPGGGGHERPPKPPVESERPQRIELSLATPSIPANGESTDVLEATVIDAHGSPLSDRHVTFSSSEPREKLTSGPEIGKAQIVTITSSTTPGLVTITATSGALVARIALQQVEVTGGNCASTGKEVKAPETSTSTSTPATTKITGPAGTTSTETTNDTTCDHEGATAKQSEEPGSEREVG